MNLLDLNTIFNRNEISAKIKHILSSFDDRCKDSDFKKGIYIYGSPGTGKTHFILDILKDLNYDVIKYDAGDVRNKSLIDTITRDNVSRHNVFDMMHGRIRKIAILMDEIDGMHKGDKGGISALVKLIRQKKTKKQKTENVTMNPIICIGNYYMDKKIKELMNVCNVFELPTPTDDQIRHIYKLLFDPVSSHITNNLVLLDQMVQYTQGDIRKIEFMSRLNEKKPEILTGDNIRHIFRAKFYNEDYGKIAKQLFDRKLTVNQHADFMNDNDRTTVALLWHENVADRVATLPKKDAFPFYLKLIDNICFADYIDRITFQSQIWIFNEMSTFIKTFYNNFIFHEFFERRCPEELENVRQMNEVRFTKILTKYSTEYSNQLFLYMLCQTLDMDKKDVVAFFQELRIFYGSTCDSNNCNHFLNKIEIMNDVEKIFEDVKICKLDIKRIYRYLDKNVKKETSASKKSYLENEEEEDEVEIAEDDYDCDE
jgi:DNA polymerase III delta prime subunit